MRARFVSLRHHMQWLGVCDKVRKLDSVAPSTVEKVRTFWLKIKLFCEAWLNTHSLSRGGYYWGCQLCYYGPRMVFRYNNKKEL